jgi:hypothetical protein
MAETPNYPAFFNPHFPGPYTYLIEMLDHYKRPLMRRFIIREMKISEEEIDPVLEDLQRMKLIKISGNKEEGVYISTTYYYGTLEDYGKDF